MHITPTIVIGAGQAGLALSRELTAERHPHVVLERGRIGERWRSQRWDSLSLLTPNWLNVLPGATGHADPDGFLAARELTRHLREYARSFAAPVAEHTTVLDVRRHGDRYRVRTDRGEFAARNVVVATGDCDLPRLPAAAADVPDGVLSLHAAEYRAPGALPPGAVLVVGAGPSGQQLALELRRAGRRVILCASDHARVPRRYRGRDIFAWLTAMGDLDVTLDELPDPGIARRGRSLAVTGGNGGEPLDLQVLAALGVGITGRLEGFDGSRALLAGDLAQSCAAADRRLAKLLARIDAHVAASGEPTAPPSAWPDRLRLPAAPRELDLRTAGVRSVIWATGYRREYPWLRVPVRDRDGEIAQHRGVTPAAGLYTLGLKFQWRRTSHFIGGVGRDAAYLAQRILAEPGVWREAAAA